MLRTHTSRFRDGSAPIEPIFLVERAPAAARVADEIETAPETKAVVRRPAVVKEYNATETAGVVSVHGVNTSFLST